MMETPADQILQNLADSRGKRATFVVRETVDCSRGCDHDEDSYTIEKSSDLMEYIIRDVYFWRYAHFVGPIIPPESESGRYICITEPGSEELMLLPFSYSYGEHINLRRSCNIVNREIATIVTPGHSHEMKRHPPIFDGYMQIAGDGDKYTLDNMVVESRPWGYERFSKLEGFGCRYDFTKSLIRGDIGQLLQREDLLMAR
jgi:hypothetical protein